MYIASWFIPHPPLTPHRKQVLALGLATSVQETLGPDFLAWDSRPIFYKLWIVLFLCKDRFRGTARIGLSTGWKISKSLLPVVAKRLQDGDMYTIRSLRCGSMTLAYVSMGGSKNCCFWAVVLAQLQTGGFQNHRSAVWIQSLTKFYTEHILTVSCWRDENKEKEAVKCQFFKSKSLASFFVSA